MSVAVNVAVAVYVPSGTEGFGPFGILTRKITVEVDPEAGVGALVSNSCVVAAAFVLDAPLQQLPSTNVDPAPVPQSVVPFPVNTLETSAVFEAFTVKPNCAYAGDVLNPDG